mgnify:CR=1 FL=1
MAAIDPSLTADTGISDRIIESIRESGPDMLEPKPMKNVRVLEEWGEDHKWSDNAYKMPGRFIYAIYNGANDTVCINPKWDGARGTNYGQKLVDNRNEYMNLKRGDAEDGELETVKFDSDTDYEPW